MIAAADFLSTLSFVEPDTIAHLGVCASAQYGLAALARGSSVALRQRGRMVSQSRKLIAGWKTLLPGFDATQHLAGPALVSQENATAVVETHVRGYQHIAAAKAGEIWMVAGH